MMADLHGTLPDQRLGVLARNRRCGLLIVAGDLLDYFRGETDTQALAATEWLHGLTTKVRHVAVCSGNHDSDSSSGASWLPRALEDLPPDCLTVDGQHAVLPDLLVTAVPYWRLFGQDTSQHKMLRAQAEGVWREGRRLARKHRLPWAVLNHEPPAASKIAIGAEEQGEMFESGLRWCKKWVQKYDPDYLFSGHIHEAPFAPGGSWAGQVQGSGAWCFNPGRNGDHLGLIEVDTGERRARWFPLWHTETCLSLELGPATNPRRGLSLTLDR